MKIKVITLLAFCSIACKGMENNNDLINNILKEHPDLLKTYNEVVANELLISNRQQEINTPAPESNTHSQETPDFSGINQNNPEPAPFNAQDAQAKLFASIGAWTQHNKKMNAEEWQELQKQHPRAQKKNSGPAKTQKKRPTSKFYEKPGKKPRQVLFTDAYPCPVKECNETYTTKSQALTHLQTHNNYPCKVCAYTTNTCEAFRNHIKSRVADEALQGTKDKHCTLKW